jgi:hypothetical protein
MADYSENDFIPGTRWRVHQLDRPQPPVVAPGPLSTMDPVAPPPDATVLFDGSSLDAFVSSRDESQANPWELLDDGTMQVVPKTGDISSKVHFGDCQLHVEFSAPTEIIGEGQGRGNSGVFLMGLYEVQVLDNYENPTYPDGTCGALYGQKPPLANACAKPGDWNIYDILWQAPRFSNGNVVSPARISVFHNGIAVQVHQELQGPTQHKVHSGYWEHPEVGPLKLQDHGDLVRFRNIWYREL